MESSQVAAIFERAAARMESCGYTRKYFIGPDGSLCAVAALVLAAHPEPDTVTDNIMISDLMLGGGSGMPDVYWQVVELVEEWARNEEGVSYDTVMEWSDNHQADHIVAVLRILANDAHQTYERTPCR